MRNTVLLGFISISLLSCSGGSENNGPSDSTKTTITEYFISDSEPSVLDAVWTSNTMFKVGRYDDGSSQDGFALYVCETLREYGANQGTSTQVIDILELVNNSKWVTLGEARCR